MTDTIAPLFALCIGDERVTHGEDADRTAVVRSPYDGRELGRVTLGTEADIDAAVAVAKARLGKPLGEGALEPYERAEILDRAAQRLSDPTVHERFARSISDEAAKPIKTARVEAARTVDTFRFAAAARSASCCACPSVWSRPSAPSTSRSTSWPTR